MRVLRARAMGLCFGVRDALAVADAVPDPRRVTIHGELVHNEAVLVQLESRGFHLAGGGDRSRTPQTPDVLVTAHGVSDAERQRLESGGARLIDTTCPLVRRAHRAAQDLHAEGRHVLIVGRRGHVEVRGLAEDLASCDVIEGPSEVRTWPHARLGIVCQTTAPPGLAEQVRLAAAALNPHADIRFVNTICQPTLDRQQAVERLAEQVDAMVVVGGRRSNNTRQLVALCRERGVPAFHVQSAADLCPEWFAGCGWVGLTAGTSTLDATIDEVAEALRRLPGGRRSSCRGFLASRQWCAHFRRNAASLFSIPWDEGVRLTEAEKNAVARSVQTFQLGESGPGRHFLRCAAGHAERTGDHEYVEAARLFIAEEQRHGADLGRFLDAAGISRLAGSRIDGLFRWLRHRARLDLAISVLLTAEVIAKVYYAALRRATGAPVLRRLCEQILKDEVAHIRFQCERLAILRRAEPPWKVRLKQLAQKALFGGTCLAVWLTHASALRAGGFGFRRFWRSAHREFRIALRSSRR